MVQQMFLEIRGSILIQTAMSRFKLLQRTAAD